MLPAVRESRGFSIPNYIDLIERKDVYGKLNLLSSFFVVANKPAAVVIRLDRHEA